MDLLKTPSIQSLLDSDLESVGSVQYVDIEELDEIEYALPESEAPTLAEVLSTEDGEVEDKTNIKTFKDPVICSALQVEFLQAISQQLMQGQERTLVGAATALSVGNTGKATVGTARGHLLSFQDQTLRWVCDLNEDCGAVTCLSYNVDSTRLLAGYARGLVFQYESVKGVILRRVTLGGETWGVLRVTWAGTSGLALDTGGSVWLMKFSRPLGVRSTRVSCLFSGARGEVVAMTARDARILALATLSRVIIVAGGRAAGIKLDGPADTLPVLEWCENDNRMLVCARFNKLQWLSINITGTAISLRPVQKVELTATPLWMGWLGGSLAIFDVNENLRILGDDYDRPLDLCYIEPVYSSAFFKGLWTDGRVSVAMCKAGESALAGICISEGTLSILGRKGIIRVRPRDVLARTQAFIASGRHLQALKLLCSTKGPNAKTVAKDLVNTLSERPHILANKNVSTQAIKLCLKFNLNEELWSYLWENCSHEKAFVEALGDAIVRGEFSSLLPTPDYMQALIEKLSDFEPDLVERVVASVPLTSLDPHRASVFTREKGLWRGVGAIAAAIDGSSGAMRTLAEYVSDDCPARAGGRCVCAGAALLLAAADALAGRGAAGRPLPEHARPLARHDALHTLLLEVNNGMSPLEVLVRHDAAAAVRLLEQSAREPPFAGPLAKQNRLRVARALLSLAPNIQDPSCRIEILDFISGQLQSGSLPLDQEVIKGIQLLAEALVGERSDRAWLALMMRLRSQRDYSLTNYRDAILRPRVQWRIDAALDCHDNVLEHFLKIESPSSLDLDEIFEYIRSRFEIDDNIKTRLQPLLPNFIKLYPQATAAIVKEHYDVSITNILNSLEDEVTLQFGQCLLDMACLKGDAAALYLRSLCMLRPAEVKDFLGNCVGIVRPEDALTIIKELGPRDAEPTCLEATGDASGALDVLLELISSNNDTKAKHIAEACDLCVRVGPTVPPNVSAEMWTRLLRRVDEVPPSLLFEAIAYLPIDELLVKTCNSPKVALTILESGAGRKRVWECARLITERESHRALVKALATARRGLAIRGECQSCGERLVSRMAVRSTHCSRAVHTDCEGETACQICGKRVPSPVYILPPLHRRLIASTPQDCPLLLVAPPRPDLDGVA
ncbi:vacuolar protein sorting-associated protein 8 homolog [Battus philenor]|uniref:vacuolar protein sorting-associated protein 8 homolog n=1 Tax=Battus philenor TaxID=42288 RepID=UPI0035CECFE1